MASTCVHMALTAGRLIVPIFAERARWPTLALLVEKYSAPSHVVSGLLRATKPCSARCPSDAARDLYPCVTLTGTPGPKRSISHHPTRWSDRPNRSLYVIGDDARAAP